MSLKASLPIAYYAAQNRLVHYTSPSASSGYSDNGMGLRVAENDSGSGQHDLINDGAAAGSSLLLDHNISAKTVREVYTPGLEQRDGLTGALHLFGVDALGTVRALVNDDAGQAVTDTFGAYAYGNPRNRTGSDAFTFAFGGADGYQSDPNGLLLLGNRVYHPFTGRFLTRDPAGAGDNDYEYADDNPLSEIDPSGLDADGALTYAQSQGLSPGAGVTETDSTTDSSGKTTSTQVDYMVINNPSGSGIAVILVPPGADLQANINAALSFGEMLAREPVRTPGVLNNLRPMFVSMNNARRSLSSAVWALSKMGPKMDWDYKKLTADKRYEDFGNFNAGAVAAAMGYDRSQFLAGAEQLHEIVNLTQTPETHSLSLAGAGYDFYMDYMR